MNHLPLTISILNGGFHTLVRGFWLSCCLVILLRYLPAQSSSSCSEETSSTGEKADVCACTCEENTHGLIYGSGREPALTQFPSQCHTGCYQNKKPTGLEADSRHCVTSAPRPRLVLQGCSELHLSAAHTTAQQGHCWGSSTAPLHAWGFWELGWKE